MRNLGLSILALIALAPVAHAQELARRASEVSASRPSDDGATPHYNFHVEVQCEDGKPLTRKWSHDFPWYATGYLTFEEARFGEKFRRDLNISVKGDHSIRPYKALTSDFQHYDETVGEALGSVKPGALERACAIRSSLLGVYQVTLADDEIALSPGALVAGESNLLVATNFRLIDGLFFQTVVGEEACFRSGEVRSKIDSAYRDGYEFHFGKDYPDYFQCKGLPDASANRAVSANGGKSLASDAQSADGNPGGVSVRSAQ